LRDLHWIDITYPSVSAVIYVFISLIYSNCGHAKGARLYRHKNQPDPKDGPYLRLAFY